MGGNEAKFPCSIKKTRLQKACRIQNKYVNKEIWELPFIIERFKWTNVDIYL